MPRNLSCDPCAARKAKCNGESPCRRCRGFGLVCMVTRVRAKSGPKGPWAANRMRRGFKNRRELQGDGQYVEGDQSGSSALAPPAMYQKIPTSFLHDCLETYHHRCYSLWPVVDFRSLQQRLQSSNDIGAYAVCTALGAVVSAQSKLDTPVKQHEESSRWDSEVVAMESEMARLQIQHRPVLDIVLSSFFLHIFYSNRGHIYRATTFLREAITTAQFLGLDQSSHYQKLSREQAQLHLRIYWTLFITERGHTTRFDYARLLKLDPNLPFLEAEELASPIEPFLQMCRLFKTFGSAMDSPGQTCTCDFFSGVDTRLLGVQRPSIIGAKLQEVDFLISQQWMRMIIWKKAMFQIMLSRYSFHGNLSISFPDRIARNMLEITAQFPRGTIESHGIGMRMKLTDVAISLADFVACDVHNSEVPQSLKMGSVDILNYLTDFVISLHESPTPQLQLLREKMGTFSMGLSHPSLKMALEPPWLSNHPDRTVEEDLSL